MFSLVFWLVLVSASADETLENVQRLRLAGDLAEAQELAEKRLEERVDAAEAIALHLELARIHDRYGLHYNTRPVAASLRHIEAASDAARASGSEHSLAEVELALADYHYRAETGGEFARARQHAERAQALFEALGELHGQADAVHKLGLIHLQRDENEQALALFDRSLELDREGGERALLRGDYERHVGFLRLAANDLEGAVPYFERSLALRRRAAAHDQALFAASTLASTLVRLGRIDEARPHLLDAMLLAERVGSPRAKAQNALVAGRIYEASANVTEARLAYETALELAESIDSAALTRQSRTALQGLEER